MIFLKIFLCVAVYALPWLGYAIGYDPPEFRGLTVPIVTSFLSLVLMGVLTYQPLRHASPSRFRIHPVAVLIASLVFYSAIHASFVRPFPKERVNGRYITGYLKPTIRHIIRDDPAYTVEEAFKGANYDTEQIWETWSINLNRTILFLLWAAVSLSFAAICSNFLPGWNREPTKFSQSSTVTDEVVPVLGSITALMPDGKSTSEHALPLEPQTELRRLLTERLRESYPHVLDGRPHDQSGDSTAVSKFVSDPATTHAEPPTFAKGLSSMKIKVLFLAANPAGTPHLALDKEIRAITEKIQAAEHRDLIEVIQAWAVRPDDLQQALLQHKPHVVHFSGHGSDADEIILLDSNDSPKPVGKEALAGLFKVLKDNVQVVVLNACYSRPQAEAITQYIPCAIGMNKAIGDRAAIAFAAAFYRAVAFGRSLQEAFDLGVNSLTLEGIPGELIPELVAGANNNPKDLKLINPI